MAALSPMGDEPMPIVHGFELYRVIGEGGFGKVWLALHLTTKQVCAIKIVGKHSVGGRSAGDVERRAITLFRQMAEEASDGFVRVHEIGRVESSGELFYSMQIADREDGAPVPEPLTGDTPMGKRVMDWVNQYRPRTVASDLRRFRRLPIDDCVKLGAILAKALALMHAQRPPVCHNDVSPTNVLYVGGKPVLADPGLVGREGCPPPARKLGYIHPEWHGTPKGDCYALGKTLYQTFTGRNPGEFPSLAGDCWPKDCKQERGFRALLRVINTACDTSEPRGIWAELGGMVRRTVGRA